MNKRFTAGREPYRLGIYGDPRSKVCDNPSLMNRWDQKLRKQCLKYCKFSNELTEMIMRNSKIINWPEKFNSKELLTKNKSEFLKLGIW